MRMKFRAGAALIVAALGLSLGLLLTTASGGSKAPARAAVVVTPPADPALGAGWSYQNSQTAAEGGDVFFADSLEGWYVGGENPTFNGGLPNTIAVVRHTTDGGATWADDTGSQAAETMAGAADDPSVTTPTGHELKTGFAVQTSTGHDHLHLNVWIIGEADDGGSCFTTPSTTNDAIILHSKNGGQTWTRQHTTPLSCGDIESIFMFPDALHGVMGANDGNYYTTSNGGGTWTAHANPSGCSSAIADSISFPDQGSKPWNQWVGFAAGCGLYRSTDGGQTWTQQSVDGSLLTCNDDSLHACWESVDALDKTHAIAVGDGTSTTPEGKNVAVYNSGTGSWTTQEVVGIQKVGSEEPNDLKDIVYLSSTRAYAFGETGSDDVGAQMFVSIDGGATWGQLQAPGGTPLMSVTNASFRLDNHAWVAGAAGGLIAFESP